MTPRVLIILFFILFTAACLSGESRCPEGTVDKEKAAITAYKERYKHVEYLQLEFDVEAAPGMDKTFRQTEVLSMMPKQVRPSITTYVAVDNCGKAYFLPAEFNEAIKNEDLGVKSENTALEIAKAYIALSSVNMVYTLLNSPHDKPRMFSEDVTFEEFAQIAPLQSNRG